MYEIYKVTNLVNGKKYIGQTSWDHKVRWWNHKGSARAGVKNYLYNAIRKYGEDKFLVELIETVETKEEADTKEKFWIKELNTTKEEFGYNIKHGGEGNKLPDSVKQKISLTNKQRFIDNPNLREQYGARKRGIKYPPSVGKKISQAKKGKRTREIYYVSDEQKIKISESLKAYHAKKRII